MRATRSTQYALLAIGYIAKNCGDGVVLSDDIAKQYDIPLEYLLKILQPLVRAKVLCSKRGPRGGFWLAKPTHKITMLEIIKAVDGTIPSELNLAKQTRKDKYATKVQETYTKAISGAKNVLEKATLSNLLGGK